MRRFEYRDAKSQKFWQIDSSGSEVTTRWGRVGADGQSKTKDFDTAAKAAAAVAKQVSAKTGKGYVEVGDGIEAPAATAVQPATAVADSATSESGPRDVPDGGEASVPGSGGRQYVLRNVGGVYSCSCPAWRNQSVSIERRTCKHLRRFRGEAAETERLGSLPVRAPSAGAKASAPAVLLAERFDPTVHDPTGWWVSEKLDGVRAWWDGERFISRLGNAFFAPPWFTEGLPSHPLDGELFAGRGKFHIAVSIARRADASEHWKQLSYVVFDAPELPGAFEARIDALRALVEARSWPHGRVLEHSRCASPESLQTELARVEALGGEGLMLRRPGSAYVSGRSESLLKVKTFFDTEAIVVGHVAGAGRHKGRLGALRVELADGTSFKVGTGLSDAQRDDPPPIGTVVSVRYQELTRAGVPRFPSYLGPRDDVDWDAAVADAAAADPKRPR